MGSDVVPWWRRPLSPGRQFVGYPMALAFVIVPIWLPNKLGTWIWAFGGLLLVIILVADLVHRRQRDEQVEPS